MSTLKTLNDLFEDQIKDLYSAEKQLVKALPKMVKAASSPALKQAFEEHLEETKGHVMRLEQVAQEVGIKPGGKHCKAMEGLIEEGGEAMEEEGDAALCDALLVAAAQRVEHYEIAGYGTARALAKQMGASVAVDLLSETLQEEKNADEGLTRICMKELYAGVATE